MTQRTTLVLSFALGTFAVGFGAFGAHALKATLEASGRVETFELGVRYLFYHSLALMIIGMLMEKFPKLKMAALFLTVGVVLFSGSLISLALTDCSGWGAVAPFGGVAMLAGWAQGAWAIYRHNS